MEDKSSFFKFLKPGPLDEVIERDNDFLWFDQDGILCTVPKDEMKDFTVAQMKEVVEEWDKEHEGEKYYMISVFHPKAKITKAQRDYMAEAYAKYIKALAVINESALGRMAVNLFVGLKPPPYPLKMFKDKESAKSWLRSLKETDE